MQQMQDNEFDKLFKDRFEEAEVMPSTDLWNNIEQGLVPQRKRTFPFYWMAAAAVVALVAVGLVFNRPQKIQLQGPVAVIEPSANQGQKTTVVVSDVPAEVEQTAANQHIDGKQEQFIDEKAQKVTDEKLPAPAAVAFNEDDRVKQQMNAKVKKEDAVIKMMAHGVNGGVKDELNDNSEKNVNPMQPNEVIARLTTKEASVEQPKEVIVMASTDVPLVTKDEVVNDNDERDRRGIRNVGDLINYVVEKVDKREEKFIQFKTDDDDNSSIIGINIGMIRFSNRKHK